MKRKIIIGFVLLLGALSIIIYILIRETPVSKLATFKPTPIQDVLYNPYMGFAPSAVNGPYPYNHKLVYKVISWRELEPQKGKYAFDELETKYKFREWNGKNVKIILRIVLDYPSDTPHLDIPDWVYDEINGDGTHYEEVIGKGFSPNYNNPILIERHKQLIRALGERYDKDPGVAFIALGSLGHCGEWHAYSSSHITIPFPTMEISDQYVQHYLDAFPNKKLLNRRPYPIAKDNNIGLYNDVFGTVSSTNDFNDWFENGYHSLLAGDVVIPAMPDFWKHAPSGGEFSSGSDVLSFLDNDQIDEIIEMARRSHISWLGPPPLSEEELTPEVKANMERLLREMGYRLRVESAAFPQMKAQGSILKVTLDMVNEGIAPFYYDWPVELSLSDMNGRIVSSSRVRGLINTWLPGNTDVSLSLSIDGKTIPGEYRLLIAILDPDTLRPAVELAMDGKQSDGRYLIGSLIVREKTTLERIRSVLNW